MPPLPRRRGLLLAALPALALPGRAGHAARAGAAGPLRPDPAVPLRGPAAAAGAVVWVHAHYTEGEPPAAPPLLARLTGPAAAGWDLWRHDRTPGRDPLLPGAAALAEGTGTLRGQGYRQVVVVGESRGAFIAVVALRHPALADALLALAPAAHGTRPERRPQALAAFAEAMGAMAADAPRRAALVLFADDPYDPDPPARAAAFAAAMRGHGVDSLLLDRPASPLGHGAARDPELDARFGACLTGFLAGTAPASACGG